MRGIFITSIVVISALGAFPALAAMTGGDFQIISDSFNVVNDSQVTGGDIVSFGSLPLQATGSQTGGASGLEAGVEALFTTDELTLTLSTSTVSLGTLSSSAISSGTVTSTVTTDSITGYTVAVSEDGNLRSGANDINDVSDGTVTAGSEEYGISTSGVDGLRSSDTAISGSVNIATNAGRVTSRATATLFEASISASTVAGSYSHSVTFTLTANP